MNNNDLNIILKEVTEEARELGIPVPFNIYPQISINGRPRKRYGCCRRDGGQFVIEISQFVLQCEADKVRQVVAHEVLHTCSGCYDHGAVWKKYADMMNEAYGYNIRRTTSREEMGLEPEAKNEQNIKYVIKCRNCGREYPRRKFTCVMKKIKAYRCSCGGELYVIDKSKSK